MSTESVETKTPEYELIGELFKAYEGKPAHVVQCRTILHLAGDVRDKSVLDLACGYGYFGREKGSIQSDRNRSFRSDDSPSPRRIE